MYFYLSQLRSSYSGNLAPLSFLLLPLNYSTQTFTLTLPKLRQYSRSAVTQPDVTLCSHSAHALSLVQSAQTV